MELEACYASSIHPKLHSSHTPCQLRLIAAWATYVSGWALKRGATQTHPLDHIVPAVRGCCRLKVLFEGAAEAFRVGVANVCGDCLYGDVRRGQKVTRALHAAADHVLVGGCAHKLSESGVQMGGAEPDVTGQFPDVESTAEMVVNVVHHLGDARRNLLPVPSAPESVELKAQLAPCEVTENLSVHIGMVEGA
jgi:hypothetical protein